MRKPSFSDSSWRSRAEGFALLAVVVLLGALAVVQHRWLGAIAEAERLKLLEEATEKAAAIAEDVDRELTRALLELRIDAKALETEETPAFAEQLERFRAESAHQALVEDVFVAERPASGPSRLKRFDPRARAFVEEAWPEEMAKIRTVVEAGINPDLPGPSPVALSLPRVMADVPALLSPVINVIVSRKSEDPAVAPTPGIRQIREMFMRHSGRGSVEILVLDPTYLNETLVRAFASRHLGSDGPFLWSVVRSADGSLVAGTEASPPVVPDAKAPLLRLRVDELDRSLLRGVLPSLEGLVSESSVRLVVQMEGLAPLFTGMARNRRTLPGH